MKETDAYPYLSMSIQKAPLVKWTGADGKPYPFRVFSFGEGGTEREVDLLKEIKNGLAEKAKGFQDSFDYILTLTPGGLPWGALVADACESTLFIGWMNRGGPLYEHVFPDEFRVKVGGPFGRELCFRGMEKGDRFLIVDDVISTGTTLRDLLTALKERELVPVGVLAIVSKGQGHKNLEREFGVPIETLMHLTKDGRIDDPLIKRLLSYPNRIFTRSAS